MTGKSVAIAELCAALRAGARERAVSLLKRDYPFAPEPIVKRQYGPVESTRVFVRDGFLDRYTSEALIFPPVLRVLSAELPNEFPYHPNWKTDLTHPAYWDLSATVDHVIPVSRGGTDDATNLVTTSMVRNSAKANWTLKELGWTLQPAGDLQSWDGLLHWFLEYTKDRPELLKQHLSMGQWHRAAILAVNDRPAL